MVVRIHDVVNRMMNVKHRGEFDAAEILGVRIAQLVQHVTVNGVGNPRLDQLEQILVVDSTGAHFCKAMGSVELVRGAKLLFRKIGLDSRIRF